MNIVDKILNYGMNVVSLDYLDAVYFRNRIFHLLNTYSNEQLEIDPSFKIEIHVLYEELKKYIIDNNIVEEGYKVEDLIDEIFSYLLDSPSVCYKKYMDIYAKDGDLASILYLKSLGEKSNYIKTFNINKNIYWNKTLDHNLIEYTINLSKPEKSNSDIKKALMMKNNVDDAPKCVLCLENLGYYGKINRDPRSTIRMIPLHLNDKEWYLQLSPYVYFENHIILFNKLHTPMVINENTIHNLVDFVDKYPSFFIGSNADLPIVGGSILSHEHYQGGTHRLPVMKSKILEEIKIKSFNNTKFYYLDWFNSTILIESYSKEELYRAFNKVFDTWLNYEDKDHDIIPFTKEERHNTVTPILEKEGDKYKLYLILRCNYTNDKYKDGVFHVHPQYFNIKKEGIGLIEAMGLFILPGRLSKEIELMEEYIKTKDEQLFIDHPELIAHKSLINSVIISNNPNIKKEIINQISLIGAEILKNTATLKDKPTRDSFFKELIK